MDDPESHRLTELVTTVEEYDFLVANAMPALLDRAAGHTRRFLRETGQWADDVIHEKLALRWGYELLERFFVCGRSEIPCRPLLLLDSLIMKALSGPEPFCYHPDLCTPLGRFLEGLAARAVISRDALIALFHHIYGLGQSQVVKLLGLDVAESQRVYKNFERWRRTGWQRAMDDLAFTEADIADLENAKDREPRKFDAHGRYLLDMIQAHYRKSDPDHFHCRTRDQWRDLYDEKYGQEYRVWHLSMCVRCVMTVSELVGPLGRTDIVPHVNLRIRPLSKAPIVAAEPFVKDGNHERGSERTRLS